jgi:hypothetical protein
MFKMGSQSGKHLRYTKCLLQLYNVTSIIVTNQKVGVGINLFSTCNTVESLLQKYILEMNSRFLGLSTADLRTFEYDLAVANKLNIPKSWNKKNALEKIV